VVELDNLVEEPVYIKVNGKLVARGEIVVVEDKFGVKITDIVEKEERVKRAL
jgi:flagellar motor switch protein FliN/FliY